MPRSNVRSKKEREKVLFLLPCALCLVPLLAVTGCSAVPKVEAEARRSRQGGDAGASSRPTAVDVALARPGVLREAPTYIGTTRPAREISLRSQAEGRLLNLTVDVGDRVARGQILAQLDDVLLKTAVTQAEAELTARQSEVSRAQTQVSNARARAEQARVELQQAQTDAKRRQFLAREGAISKQDAELAVTAARSDEQIWRAAQEQIRTEEQAVAAAIGRVAAQRATLAQARERQSYARLVSPINGAVLERVSEPGNLVQPGSEVLKLGDFSRVKVVVPISELELSNIQVGQSVEVRLDAFPKESFSGAITRISPAADPTSRQLPVEVTTPNSDRRIGSGMLARVSFSRLTQARIIVPQTALQVGGQGGRGAEAQVGRGESSDRGNRGDASNRGDAINRVSTILFVVNGEGREAKVTARSVQVGDRANSKVEILSGLQAGERFVVRSGKPLKDGETVRLSILSETGNNQGQSEGKSSKAPTP